MLTAIGREAHGDKSVRGLMFCAAWSIEVILFLAVDAGKRFFTLLGDLCRKGLLGTESG